MFFCRILIFFRNFTRYNKNDHMQPFLNLKPSIDEIERLHPFIAQASEAAGLTERGAKQLRLAVEEAVVNIVNYGQATVIRLHAMVEDDRLLLTIDDDGLPFDPTSGSPTDQTVPADQRPVGGLGIILMQQMTDAMSYQRIDGHNILTMTKGR